MGPRKKLPQTNAKSNSPEDAGSQSAQSKSAYIQDFDERVVGIARTANFDKAGLAKIQADISGKDYLDYADRVHSREIGNLQDGRAQQARSDQRQDRIRVVGAICATVILCFCLYLSSPGERDKIIDHAVTLLIAASGGAGGYAVGRHRKKAEPASEE